MWYIGPPSNIFSAALKEVVPVLGNPAPITKEIVGFDVVAIAPVKYVAATRRLIVGCSYYLYSCLLIYPI